MQRIETKSLHKGVAGARHTFVPQTGAQNKLDLLLQVQLPTSCLMYALYVMVVSETDWLSVDDVYSTLYILSVRIRHMQWLCRMWAVWC